MFNFSVGNTTPYRFNSFVKEFKIDLLKRQQRELILVRDSLFLQKKGKLVKRYLEAFSGWKEPSGKVDGYFFPISYHRHIKF